MKVQSKVIVVTGGGSGIGRELTLALLQKSARVAAADLNAATLAETAELAGGLKSNLSTHVLNIADRPAVEAFPQAVIDAHGTVDGIINNAGVIQRFVKFKDLPYAEIERMINVNFYGVIYMTKAFLPHLLTRPAAHIVNISSMGGFLPVPGQTLYGAAKAAVKLFTEGLYSELSDTSVRVTVVFPGAVATNITVNSGVMTPSLENVDRSKMRAVSPASAARIILDGMERDAFRVLVGSDARMMDTFYRLMPKRAARLIYSQMGELLKNA